MSVTAAQRAYLRAFDDWLRSPSPRSTEARQGALDALCREAGITPTRVSEQRETIMEAPAANGPRPVHQVTADALAELKRREAMLERAVVELNLTRKAIQTLEHLHQSLHQSITRPASTPEAQTSSSEPDDGSVVEAVRIHQPTRVGVIAEALGIEPADAKARLKRLIENNQIVATGVRAGTRYHLAGTR